MSTQSMPIIHRALIGTIPKAYRGPAFHLSTAMQALCIDDLFDAMREFEESARFLTTATLVNKVFYKPGIKSLPFFKYLIKKYDRKAFLAEQAYFEERIDEFKNTSKDARPYQPKGLSTQTKRRALVYYSNSPKVTIYSPPQNDENQPDSQNISSTKDLFSLKEKITLLHLPSYLLPRSSVQSLLKSEDLEDQKAYIEHVEKKYKKSFSKLLLDEKKRQQESGLIIDEKDSLSFDEKIGLLTKSDKLLRKSYRTYLQSTRNSPLFFKNKHLAKTDRGVK